jgi:hypothetical protein
MAQHMNTATGSLMLRKLHDAALASAPLNTNQLKHDAISACSVVALTLA